MNKSIIIALIATLVSTGVAANPPGRANVDSEALSQLITTHCGNHTENLIRAGMPATAENTDHFFKVCVQETVKNLK